MRLAAELWPFVAAGRRCRRQDHIVLPLIIASPGLKHAMLCCQSTTCHVNSPASSVLRLEDKHPAAGCCCTLCSTGCLCCHIGVAAIGQSRKVEAWIVCVRHPDICCRGNQQQGTTDPNQHGKTQCSSWLAYLAKRHASWLVVNLHRFGALQDLCHVVAIRTVLVRPR